ncbi:MAG TPA: FHA domain-containing protein, partial [Acidobacteriota bacterium]
IFNPEIGIKLEKIILQALQKKVEKRYQSARDMIDDLRKVRNDLTKAGLTGFPGVTQKIVVHAQKKRALLLTPLKIIAFLFLLLAGVALFVFLAGKSGMDEVKNVMPGTSREPVLGRQVPESAEGAASKPETKAEDPAAVAGSGSNAVEKAGAGAAKPATEEARQGAVPEPVPPARKEESAKVQVPGEALPDRQSPLRENESTPTSLGSMDAELARLRGFLEARNLAAADRLTEAMIRSGAETRALPMLGKVKFFLNQFAAAEKLWAEALQDNLLISLEMVHRHADADDFCLGQLTFNKKTIMFNSRNRGDHSFALPAGNVRSLTLENGMMIHLAGVAGGQEISENFVVAYRMRRLEKEKFLVAFINQYVLYEAWMKKSQFSAPDAAGRGRNSGGLSKLNRAYAAFPLSGLWQNNKATLLLAAVVVVAVVILFIQLARRRRLDTFPEIAPAAPPAASELDMTQIEPPPDSGERRPAPSPGIHGKIEVLVGDQQISSFLVTDNPLPIGRDPAQSLVVIQEPIVSKLHCQIYARGGQVFVKDLNSTNGVYIHDEKVSEQELQDSDVVFLGKKGTVKIIYHL